MNKRTKTIGKSPLVKVYVGRKVYLGINLRLLFQTSKYKT